MSNLDLKEKIDFVGLQMAECERLNQMSLRFDTAALFGLYILIGLFIYNLYSPDTRLFEYQLSAALAAVVLKHLSVTNMRKINSMQLGCVEVMIAFEEKRMDEENNKEDEFSLKIQAKTLELEEIKNLIEQKRVELYLLKEELTETPNLLEQSKQTTNQVFNVFEQARREAASTGFDEFSFEIDSVCDPERKLLSELADSLSLEGKLLTVALWNNPKHSFYKCRVSKA